MRSSNDTYRGAVPAVRAKNGTRKQMAPANKFEAPTNKIASAHMLRCCNIRTLKWVFLSESVKRVHQVHDREAEAEVEVLVIDLVGSNGNQ